MSCSYSIVNLHLRTSSGKWIDLAHFSSGPFSKTMPAQLKKIPKKIRPTFTLYNIKLFEFLWHQILKGTDIVFENGPDEKFPRSFH